jgi:stage V sporulation protein B
MAGKTKKFLVNTAVLTASSLTVSTAAMAFNAYISQKIGAETMGVFQLIMSAYAFAVTLAVSGIGLASSRLAAEELALGHEKGVKRAVGFCLLYAAAFGTVAALLLFSYSTTIGAHWLHNKLTVLPLRLLAVSLPFISMSAVLTGYFNAARKAVKTASANIFEQAVRITAIIYLFTAVLPGGIENACYAIVLGGMIAEILSFAYSYSLYIYDKKKYTNKLTGANIAGRLLEIALPVALSSYIRSFLGTVQQIMTPIFLEKSGASCKTSLSAYGAIRGMVMPAVMFPATFLYSFSSLLVPEIAQLHITGNPKRIKFIINKIFKWTLVFSLLTWLILFVFSNRIGLLLYKSQDAASYIKIFSFIAPVIYFDLIADGMLKGLNRQADVVKINILETAVTITLTWLLLPLYGVYGYIAVIFAGEALNTCLSLRKLKSVIR